MKLVIGLGNPGKLYAKTRHNVGFMVLDLLHEQLNMPDWKLSKKFNSKVSEKQSNGGKMILAKPMTYMNASGLSVKILSSFYKIKPKDIIVIHDDKDLALGDVKIQDDRGHAGHNGVKSIMQHLNSQKFTRVRMGIASENAKKMEDVSKFVLSKFSLFERKKVKEMIEQGIKEVKKTLELATSIL